MPRTGRPFQDGHGPVTDGPLCPKGHKLPRRTELGSCTAVRCADYDIAGNKLVDKTTLDKVSQKRPVEAEIDMLERLGGEAPEVVQVARRSRADEIVKVATAAGRRAARLAHFKVPEGLKGEEAEKWTKERALELLPLAIAEMEYMLMLGSDNQRIEAARDILDMNGLRKKDVSSGGGGATIVLNLGTKDLPWAQRVVEAVAAKNEKK